MGLGSTPGLGLTMNLMVIGMGIISVGFAAWQASKVWNQTLAVAIGLVGLAVTLVVPFGPFIGIGGGIFLYYRASEAAIEGDE